MDKLNTFIINEVVDLTEDNTFSIVDAKYDDWGVLVIKDSLITLYEKSRKKTEFGSDYEKMIEYVYENGCKFVKLKNGDHRWKEYNPNPLNRKTGDCTLRAYCAAFNVSWEEAFDEASKVAKEMGYILDNPNVVKKVVEETYGAKQDPKYTKKTVKSKDRITVNEFALTHPYGIYVLHVRSHLVTIRDGEYWDSWDSGDKKVDEVWIVLE
jgi:hypothetical protein